MGGTLAFTGHANGFVTLRYTRITTSFVPVTGISGIPSSMNSGASVLLPAYANPSNATYRMIVWERVSFSGLSYSQLGDNSLYVEGNGWIDVRATVINGWAVGTDYGQTFRINVIGGGGGYGCYW